MATPVPTSARTVILQNYASAEHDVNLSPSGTFAIKDIPIPNPLPEDSLLVQMIYLSNDAGLRLFTEESIKFEREDLVTLPLGTPFPTFAAIGRIVQVGGNVENGPHKVGNIVEVAYPYWADYVVVKKDKAKLRK